MNNRACALAPACPQVLRDRLPFDEVALLRENASFLLRSLGLEALEVHAVSYEQQQAEGADAQIAAATPGSPATLFRFAA